MTSLLSVVLFIPPSIHVMKGDKAFSRAPNLARFDVRGVVVEVLGGGGPGEMWLATFHR